MHDYYNTEMYTRSRCQDLLAEAENERRLAQVGETRQLRTPAPEFPFTHVQIVIEPLVEGRKRIMVEVR